MGAFPVNAAAKPRVLQLRSQLFQLAVLIAVDRHQALLVETHTSVRSLQRVKAQPQPVQAQAQACYPASRGTERPVSSFERPCLRLALVRNKIRAEGSKTVNVDCRM